MSQIKSRKVLIVAVYSHIEAYPPSLNALFHLATLFDTVYLVHRNVMVSHWQYPPNVKQIAVGKFIEADKVKDLPFWRKVYSFIEFGLKLRKVVKSTRPELVLVYDAAPFVLFNIFSGWFTIHKPFLWYHNHDVIPETELPRYSLMWFIRKLELHYFRTISQFTLPNTVRLSYFPIDRLRVPPIILPNYPSRFFYGKWQTFPPEGDVVKILFQGHISSYNGIESLLDILPEKINGKRLELHLAGPITPPYKSFLIELARRLNVRAQLFIYGRLPYFDLPALTAACHIGIAFYGNHNVMVRTMSTASNKLFEYASVGLPVLVNKRSDMEEEFSNFQWIHFTEMNALSLQKKLNDIVTHYNQYSALAKKDFGQKLNFENSFLPFIEHLKTKL